MRERSAWTYPGGRRRRTTSRTRSNSARRADGSCARYPAGVGAFGLGNGWEQRQPLAVLYEVALVREPDFAQHVLRRGVRQTRHRHDGGKLQLLAPQRETRRRDFGGESLAPESRIERVANLYFIHAFHQEMSQYRPADGRTAAQLPQDPPAESLLAPMLQVAGEIGSVPGLVAHAAEVLHDHRVAVHAANLGEVLGGEPLGLEASGGEGIRHQA